MMRSFKYRIYPTKSQLSCLEATLEGCRYVYNETLELRKEAWEKNKDAISLYESYGYVKILREYKEELYDINIGVLNNAQTKLDLAFTSFFRRYKSGKKPGYPRFKSKNQYNSFTFPQPYPKGGFKLLTNKILKLSLIGDIKIKLHRPLESKIKTLTIKKTSTGKWFATFSCELEDIEKIETKSIVGIDLGLTTFATMSDGTTIPRQRFFKQYEKRLAHIQQKKAKLKYGSKQRNKVRLVESKIHEKLTNIRKDFAHKESLNLVNKYDLIVFEDLNINNMKEGNLKNVRKCIADVAWNQFVQFTSYKAENAGKKVILVDPRNTSKICSGCGKIVDKSLSTRSHSCSCGLIMDRDLNASINILRRGLSSLGNLKALESKRIITVLS